MLRCPTSVVRGVDPPRGNVRITAWFAANLQSQNKSETFFNFFKNPIIKALHLFRHKTFIDGDDL